MKIYFLLLSMFACITIALGQNDRAAYAKAIKQFREFYNNEQPDSLYKMYSQPVKAALSVAKTKELLAGLYAQTGKINHLKIQNETAESVIYRGAFEKTEMDIVFALNNKNQIADLNFNPVNANEESLSNFNIKTEQGATIYGTLLQPEKAKKGSNIVLLISGSGQINRDGNFVQGGGTNAFKMLADSLRKAGISSVRYDKRGTGESFNALKSESDLNFNDLVSDVVAFVAKIKSSKKFDKIFIAGDNEASLIAMVAANKTKVDGLISIAGTADAGDEVLRKQIKANVGPRALEIDSVLEVLKSGNKVVIENKYLMTTFRTSIQNYMISWFPYDPKKEISKLNIPILLLYGARDLQVSEDDVQKLKDSKKGATMIVLPEMNHVLKDVSADRDENVKSYNNLNMPLSAGLSQEIIKFCKQKR